MKKITLFNLKAIHKGLLSLFLFTATLVPAAVNAQSFCNNEVVYWTENFGTGTDISSDPNIVNLSYDPVGVLAMEGIYRVANNTFQLDDWHNSPDHTPADVDGKMLVINGDAGDFYVNTLNRQSGFSPGFYAASLSIMNVNTLNQCSPNPLLPVIRFKLEYQDANGNWIELNNSPVTTAGIPQTSTPTWLQVGGTFTLPTTGVFLVTNMRLTLANETVGGCGNDFAIDDIKLASCPDGGPLPVQFINISATKKGSGVTINWATASEVNNEYFEVEKSNDGGYSWNTINKTRGSINSNVTKNYAAYDATPAVGANYYRVRQVDRDGTSKYSATVVFKLTLEKTDVSVLANPFNTNITIDILSNRNQVMQTRLFDNTGKLVNSQRLNIATGSTRKALETSALNRGMYILQVIDENGNTILSNKLIKQ